MHLQNHVLLLLLYTPELEEHTHQHGYISIRSVNNLVYTTIYLTALTLNSSYFLALSRVEVMMLLSQSNARTVTTIYSKSLLHSKHTPAETDVRYRTLLDLNFPTRSSSAIPGMRNRRPSFAIPDTYKTGTLLLISREEILYYY
jgi:hypothetical protein